MKKMYWGFCSYSYSFIFLDQDFNYISDVHENDGDWRSEYFNPIMNHFGIEVKKVDFDKILKKFEKKIENGKVNLWDINYKELKIV